ncbi:sugar ABC transporter permease [Candidatus Poribacteria bacterium]|nr:sugar ABC transporter permease [Candidatus Poribacteria bacterium]
MPLIRRARGLSDYQIKMLFIIPTLALLIAMNIFPLLWSLYLSFTKYKYGSNLPRIFIGTENYSQILSNRNIWSYFTTTAKFVLLAVAAQFLIGFGLALLLNREFKYKGIVTTLILLPMMLSPVVVGLFWKFIFDPDTGIFNYFLKILFRVEKIGWTTNPKTALFSVVIVDTWMWSPFMMLISLAGLSAIPKYLYEAADVDRASGWFKFRHITLPMVAPLLLIALLFRTMDAFKLFDLVYTLTNEGGPGVATETVSMNLYKIAFRRWDIGQASAMAYILLIIIIALSSIYIKYLNKVRGET